MRVRNLPRAVGGLMAALLIIAQSTWAQAGETAGLFVYPASEGAAIAFNGQSYGVVDGAGRVIHPFDYERIEDFSDAGIAAAVRQIPGLQPGSYNGWGVIDRKGQVILPFNYVFIAVLGEGMITAIDRGGKQRLFDASGREFVTPPGFAEVQASSTPDFMIVSDSEGLRALTTRDGRPVIPGRYDAIVLYPHINVATAYDAEYDEELAFDLGSGKQISDRGYSSLNFVGGDQSGFQRRWIIHGGLESDSPAKITDFSGKPLGAGKFEGAGIAKDGLFVLKQGGRWGVLDENATVIVPFKAEYEDYLDINKGKITAELGNGWGQMDYTGNILTPFQFISWGIARTNLDGRIRKDNPFSVMDRFTMLTDAKTGREGVIDAQNNWIIPLGAYDEIGPVFYSILETGAELAEVRIAERWGIFDLTRKREVMAPRISDGSYSTPETSTFSGFTLVWNKAKIHTGLVDFRSFEYKQNTEGFIFTKYIWDLDSFVFSRGTYDFNCGSTGTMGVMRRDGSILIEPNYEMIRQAGINKGEPELFYATKQGRAGFLDTSGRIAIPFKFRPLTDEYGCHTDTFFHQGHINIGQEKDVVLINAKGEVVAKASDFMLSQKDVRITLFQFAGRPLPGISHGPDDARMLRFQLDGNIYDTPVNAGLIGGGELFNDVDAAEREKLLLVRRSGKWGYLDASGREAIPLVYDNASPFRNGAAYVQQGSNFEVINRSGDSLQHYDPAVARMRRSKVWQ